MRAAILYSICTSNRQKRPFLYQERRFHFLYREMNSESRSESSRYKIQGKKLSPLLLE